MTKREAAIITAYTDKLVGKYEWYSKYVKETYQGCASHGEYLKRVERDMARLIADAEMGG